MVVSTSLSFIISSISALLIFSGMQMYKPWLSSSQIHTVFGGYLGSLLFIFVLTAIGNLENCMFGKTYQAKMFPEAVISILLALLASGMIHRVCATSCLLISSCALYYINRYSQKVYAMQNTPTVTQPGRKKKN